MWEISCTPLPVSTKRAALRNCGTGRGTDSKFRHIRQEKSQKIVAGGVPENIFWPVRFLDAARVRKLLLCLRYGQRRISRGYFRQVQPKNNREFHTSQNRPGRFLSKNYIQADSRSKYTAGRRCRVNRSRRRRFVCCRKLYGHLYGGIPGHRKNSIKACRVFAGARRKIQPGQG